MPESQNREMVTEKQKRVLFVDDDSNILQMLDRILHQSGEDWETEFYLDPDVALEALAKRPFDAVVTDIRMPQKDGYTLIAAMQNDEELRRIPIIVLTGVGDMSLKRRVLDMGATDLLNKPVAREELLARLRNVLRLKEYDDLLHNQMTLLDGLVQERTRQLERSHREIMWRLAKAGEFRDDQTGNHVARVAWCSCILAEGLGVPSQDIEILLQTSPLHDIGKIGIPDSILLKPATLTSAERQIIERHTVIGEEILQKKPKATELLSSLDTDTAFLYEDCTASVLLDRARTIARHHHEKWDGSGYPDGLAGRDIPLEARIVAVADVYDALISNRPYKKSMPEKEAQALVRKEAGHHFDPDVVNVFMNNLDRIREIHQKFEESSIPLLVGGYPR
jgi:response regulator RpfG family c-di-GMP phosphodiesterase